MIIRRKEVKIIYNVITFITDISVYKQPCLLDLVTRFVFMWNRIFVARTKAVHSPIVLINPVKLYIIFLTRYTHLLHKFIFNFIHYTY